MHRVLTLAAAAFLIAAPISLAQTDPPQTPPPTTAPPTTTPPPAQPTPPPTEPATPADPATPATPASPSMSSDAPEGCRTSKAEGEACACLSDTSRIGTAEPHPDGHNVCVRPD